ncbi:hypothetical protein [Amycolatopsis sp. lyj-84]|uniref:non-homologous end-joining DNA ligase LigD n=1 Tax=Amycolatopsis sp. lyj-84 TaxID=2789284 RepID=UPI00397E8C20
MTTPGPRTFVVPYSLRARPGTGVATSIEWRELGKASPDGWNPTKIRRRLSRKDGAWRKIDADPDSAADALVRLGS